MPTVALAPMPKWYFVANNGDPLGAGRMWTYKASNPDETKLTYSDPGGSIPNTNPIVINANGTFGPIYWEVDEPYYIAVTSTADRSSEIYNVDNFSPPSDGGGGSATTYINLDNLVVNGSFWRNIGTSSTPAATSLTLAPSSHAAFSTPDMTFTKTATANSDTITFTQFTDGTIPFGARDITPLYFMNYTSTGTAAESNKYIQFPIMPKVKNLEQQELTFSIWAKTNGGGSNTLEVWIEQFFGTGTNTPSDPAGYADVKQITLTASWEQYILHFIPATIGGKTIGNSNNDSVNLKIQYPLSDACNIDIAKPSLYTGNLTQETISNFETFDEVDSIVNAPRMGDIRISLNAFQPFGWVPANDGTIGNSSSGGTSRAANDTFFLFKHIWDNVNNFYAPIYDSAGAVSTRGATAVIDYAANKRLQLTRAMGRVLAGMNPVMVDQFTISGLLASTFTISSTATMRTGSPIYILSTASVPAPLVNGQVYYAILMTATEFRVALSLEDAFAGTNIVITTALSGTTTVHPALGATDGQGDIVGGDLPTHSHPVQTYTPDTGTYGPTRIAAANNPAIGSPQAQTNDSLGNLTMSMLQPTTFYNIFIKL